MIHGYTFEKNGSHFTRITGFDPKTLNILTQRFIRYDDNQIHGNAMFLHTTKEELDSFYNEFDIIPIGTVDEFRLIAMLMY